MTDESNLEMIVKTIKKNYVDYRSHNIRVFVPQYINQKRVISIGRTETLRKMRFIHLATDLDLKKIKLNNVRKLKGAELNLTDVNIIAGVNSSGKSSLLESLALLPRFIDQDYHKMRIPLGDDYFNFKNFSNFLSFDAKVDEDASISLTYKNIDDSDGRILGDLTVSYIFDDMLRFTTDNFSKEDRDFEIKKYNYLPIKELRINIDQEGEGPDKERGFIPIKAEYGIRQEKPFSNKNTIQRLFGATIESLREEHAPLNINSSNNIFNLSHGTKIVELNNEEDNLAFFAEVSNFEEGSNNIDTRTTLFGVNFDHNSLSLRPTIQEFRHKNEDHDNYSSYTDRINKSEIILDGYLSINISKYLRLLLIDTTSQQKNKINKKLYDSESIKLIQNLIKRLCEESNTSEDKVLRHLSSMDPRVPETMDSIEYQIVDRAVKASVYILGFAPVSGLMIDGEETEADFESLYGEINEQFLGAFDYEEYMPDDGHAITLEFHKIFSEFGQARNILWMDEWFNNDNFNSEKITKFVSENIKARKRLMTWGQVSKEYISYYEEQFGDYKKLFKDFESLIKETTLEINRKINNLDTKYKDVIEIQEKFVLKIKQIIRDSGFNMKLLSRWHNHIGHSDDGYSLRDLVSMNISDNEHKEESLFIPVLRKNIYSPDLNFRKLISKITGDNTYDEQFFGRELFSQLKNIKNLQFLGPLRDRGDSAKLFYRNEIPFSVGIHGEYSKTFLKENAQTRGKFISTKIFDTKNIDKLKIFSNKNKDSDIAEQLEKEKIIVDRTLIEHLSEWAEYMGLCKEFVLNEDFDTPSISVVDFDNNKVDLVNVGVGVSQVLPVLLICSIPNLNNIKQLTILEQPELHLHPGAQAKLADFLIASSLYRCHLIIETHSEYTVSRMRYRYAELNKVFPDNIQINFVSEGKNGSSVYEEINLNKKGGLDSYPEGFFDQAQIQAMDFLDLSKKQEK